MENFENIEGLFNEWLIFEFKLNSQTIAAQYYFKNPDSLAEELLDELKQILETQFFDMLEIVDLKRGEWLKAYAFSTGKTYKIYEKRGSLSLPSRGSFWGRLAKVKNRWYLVGSNPLSFPVSHTPRAKKIFLKENKGQALSAQDVLKFLLPDESKESKKPDLSQLTLKSIKNKRKKIEKRFNKLIKKYDLKTTFQEVVDFVYRENYKTNHADFYKDITKLGIPENIVFKNIQLFGDIWNYFPHKNLKNKSPAEMYRKRYG